MVTGLDHERRRVEISTAVQKNALTLQRVEACADRPMEHNLWETCDPRMSTVVSSGMLLNAIYNGSCMFLSVM